ncbi:MAG TPA: hypothetical protein VL400_13250 [Polyangiaceae bacterium]|jgi:hypothetical protein|nr:hypothetical protein [Polyangiaceae bacterium]
MKKQLLSLSPIVLCLALAACGNTFAMAPDASVPFATGEVDASFEDNGNGKMTVSVEHLGDPSKLSPSATTYVVWIKPKKEGAAIQNVGALKVDDSYSGELEFSTTQTAFDITITPEASADVTDPKGRDVLRATITK